MYKICNKARLHYLIKKLLQIEQTYYFDFSDLQEIVHIISEKDPEYCFKHGGSNIQLIKDYFELSNEEYDWLFSANWLQDDLCIDILQRLYILVTQGLPNKYNLYIRNLVPKDWYAKININQIKTYLNTLTYSESQTISINKYLENLLK